MSRIPPWPPLQDMKIMYDLFAIVEHNGNLEGGHYTAVCKEERKWYKYDDSHVIEIQAGSVNSSAAYILLYQKKYVQVPADETNVIVFSDDMKRKIIFPVLKAIYVSYVDNGSNPVWVRLIDDYYDEDGEVALYLRQNGVGSNCVRSDLLDDFLKTRESYQTLENYDNVKKKIEEIGVENLNDCDINEALCLKKISNYSSI